MRATKAMLLCALLAAAGCKTKKYVNEARAVANHFYRSRTAGADMEKTLAFYSPALLAREGKEGWEAKLEGAKGRLGDVRSWKYHPRVEYKNKVGANERLPGKRVFFELDVTYTRWIAQEAVTLYKPADESTGWLIIAHTISPREQIIGGTEGTETGREDEGDEDDTAEGEEDEAG